MKIVLSVLSLALAGCGAMNRQAIDAAPTKSSFMLCSNLVTATMASAELRNAWADELQRRGENCQQYMPAISANQAAQANSNTTALQLLQMGQPRPAAPDPMGNLLYQSTAGTTRFCVYDKNGQKVTVQQPQLAPCPASL